MADFNNPLNIICLESKAFYALVEDVVEKLKEKQGIEHDKWISAEEAMKLLRISSKSTLQKYRDTGEIRFAPLGKKHILYDYDSILEFLDKKSKNTF
ncbi:MAG: DNA-binding protein [Bacteroidetes bacterium]|nr:MAG: DNA-binding protein [Bacteroidota bacterium]